MRALAAICAFLLVACVPKSDSGAFSRSPALDLAPPSFLVADLREDERRRLAGLLDRSLERSIVSRGYERAPDGDGSPVLRSTWVRDSGESAVGGEPALAISFSVFSPDGVRLMTARSVRGLPSRAWTEDRVNAEVGHLMRGFPERRP